MARKKTQTVDRWAADNRLAPNYFAYGVMVVLFLLVVGFVLLAWVF